MMVTRRGSVFLAAALLWSGASSPGEAAAKEKHSPGRANYVGPTPKDNSHYKFDYDGKPLFGEDKKKKKKAKKAKQKKKSKKNKWRPRPGKRSPKRAAPPPEEDDELDSEDTMEPGAPEESAAKPGGEPPPRGSETEASGKEKQDGEGFNYGGVKVGGGGPKFGGIPPTGQ